MPLSRTGNGLTVSSSSAAECRLLAENRSLRAEVRELKTQLLSYQSQVRTIFSALNFWHQHTIEIKQWLKSEYYIYSCCIIWRISSGALMEASLAILYVQAWHLTLQKKAVGIMLTCRPQMDKPNEGRTATIRSWALSWGPIKNCFRWKKEGSCLRVHTASTSHIFLQVLFRPIFPIARVLHAISEVALTVLMGNVAVLLLFSFGSRKEAQWLEPDVHYVYGVFRWTALLNSVILSWPTTVCRNSCRCCCLLSTSPGMLQCCW